ncbi:VanZ family protein [Streptomyces sp. NPDC051776]|uniref:VanZ family protein n=1 Tax=Streptomyces sp. NPDC051776 TaxID=3155414 RepID=UPI003441093A
MAWKGPGTARTSTSRKRSGTAGNKAGGKADNKARGKARGKAGNPARSAASRAAKKASPVGAAAKSRRSGPAKKSGGTPRKQSTSAHQRPWSAALWRSLAMVVAFVGMVAFAVVLARLTLAPSSASESLVHSNLRPGDSIRAYLEQPALRDAFKQIGGNILLGVPFGLLLPVLLPKARGPVRVAIVTTVVMMLVELVQGAIVEGRAFDIDDVLLNVSGALLGYLIAGRRAGRALHPRRHH